MAESKTFLGHPCGLYILFFTEMWERFSYYGMRSLLVYYMMKQLLFTESRASEIYGLYTGLVYFTPFLGGIIADRWLGQRKAVMVGAVIMALGHFLMALDGLFYIALLFLIIGNGFFKPNISTQVGSLYSEGDHRRDRAFNIFYVGINLGAFFAPLVCGTLGELYGWDYGFTAAGIGMLAGLLVYVAGQKHLAPDNQMKKALENPSPSPAKSKGERVSLSPMERSRILVLISVCLFTLVFFMAYEQQGNTMAMWADEDTDRHLFGWEIPASWFQSLNPFFIFFFTPLLTSLWTWMARRGREPDSVMKMAWGCMLLGVSFLIMTKPASIFAVDGIPVSMWWLVLQTMFLTLGELCLSPIGLSLVTKLAPLRMVSMMMGVWFISQFAGNLIAGFAGGLWESTAKDTFFLIIGACVIAAGSGLLLYHRWLWRHRPEIVSSL